MAQNTNGTLRLKSHFISVLWAAVKMGFYVCMVFLKNYLLNPSI